MRTKLSFISTFLLLHVNFLFAQCISIELSVIWEKEPHIHKKCAKVKTPKLNISYHNNCDTNYYFLKVSNNKDNLLGFICTLLVGHDPLKKPDYHAMVNYLAKSYSNQHFNVSIRFPRSSYFGCAAEVYPDTIDISKARGSDAINCSLNAFSSYIRYKKNPNYLSEEVRNPDGSFKRNFEPSDLLPENILGSMKDEYVFLKSGETYIDTYNLIAFQIIEGCYTFFVYGDTIMNYVSKNYYDSKLKKFVDEELALPARVGEYQLYSGGFNTNKVTVCFGENVGK